MSAETEKKPATISLELDGKLLAGLDDFTAAQGDVPSREEAARRILREALRAKGYLRFYEREEGTKPQDLSSANDG